MRDGDRHGCLMLLPHAWPKFMILGAQGVAANILARRGIEPALPIAYLIMFLELVGAICITIGFLTRPFALLLLIEMLIITAFVVSSYSAQLRCIMRER